MFLATAAIGSLAAVGAFAGSSIELNSSSNSRTVSCDFGDAHSSRYAYLLANTTNAGAVSDSFGVSSVDFNGVAGTRINTPASGTAHFTLWYAHLPTGASGDVTVTRSTGSGFSAVRLSVFVIRGLRAPTVPVFTRLDTGGLTTDPVTVAVTTSSGGVVIGQANNATSLSPFVWTGGWSRVGTAAESAPNAVTVESALMNETSGGTTNLTVDTDDSSSSMNPLIASFR